MSLEQYSDSYSYFFPHGLDYGSQGQSLQDLIDSGDYAGRPKIARNAQDGHRDVRCST
jgi:hypothetical protein